MIRHLLTEGAAFAALILLVAAMTGLADLASLILKGF